MVHFGVSTQQSSSFSFIKRDEYDLLASSAALPPRRSETSSLRSEQAKLMSEKRIVGITFRTNDRTIVGKAAASTAF